MASRFYHHSNEKGGNGERKGFPKKPVGSGKEEAALAALRSDLREVLRFGTKGKKGSAALERIAEKAGRIGEEPKEVQHEIVRSLKILAAAYLDGTIRELKVEGELEKAVSAAIAEVDEFTKRCTPENGQECVAELERYALGPGNGDFEFASMIWLARMSASNWMERDSLDAIVGILGEKDAGEEAIGVSVRAMVDFGDVDSMITVLENAKGRGDPALKNTAHHFYEMLPVRYEESGEGEGRRTRYITAIEAHGDCVPGRKMRILLDELKGMKKEVDELRGAVSSMFRTYASGTIDQQVIDEGFGKILEHKERMNELPPLVAKEVVRSVKRISMLIHNDVVNGELEGMMEMALASGNDELLAEMTGAQREIGDFAHAVVTNDVVTLEQHALHRTDFEFNGALGLLNSNISGQRLGRVLEHQKVGEETLMITVAGLLGRGDYLATTMALKNAERNGHPKLGFIAEEFASRIVREGGPTTIIMGPLVIMGNTTTTVLGEVHGQAAKRGEKVTAGKLVDAVVSALEEQVLGQNRQN